MHLHERDVGSIHDRTKKPPYVGERCLAGRFTYDDRDLREGKPVLRFVQCVGKGHLYDSGTLFLFGSLDLQSGRKQTELHMNGLIYLVGLIVVILFILSLLGLR